MLINVSVKLSDMQLSVSIIVINRHCVMDYVIINI